MNVLLIDFFNDWKNYHQIEQKKNKIKFHLIEHGLII